MNHWQKIRDAAALTRTEICAADGTNSNELLNAPQFVAFAAEYLELDLIPEHPDSGNLQKALAVLEDDCVYYNNHLKPWYKAFCIAHEIGHFVLHHQSLHCTEGEIESYASEGETSQTEKILGYGAGDRREREANLFALELLLPCEVLRNLYLERKHNARAISEITGMPLDAVCGQLARALLVPVSRAAEKIETAEKRELNPSQKRAAETENCPTLVYAGPGTGKTQTLTARIAHLIERGTEPKRILALTFSNKAAEEMRERVSRIDETADAKIQVMTFHAYGLDILRSFWVEAELDPRTPMLDKIDALLHLEKNLAVLNLEHYQSLHEPTHNLGAILGAISRAKDELCDPPEYLALGEKMLAEARSTGNEELELKAKKVIETAHVYRFYQDYLKSEKLLDFGDLVARAVKLLQSNEAVKREVQAKYDAILVDEFQDVNRACGVLLKEIAGVGNTLWTVGDLRQSIYRWRGASPANIELFGVDFPSAETVALETNYRSRTEIVELFANFARQMKTAADESFNSWEAARGAARLEALKSVKVEIADSLGAEAANIARQIENYHASGLKYKDCAIICRTHAQLNKFAAVLSAKGIPVFYLGELFERAEVRDLLALLDLKVTPGSHSLIRVAGFPEYGIPLSDARRIIQAQKDNSQTFAEVLSDEKFRAELSAEGKQGTEKLLRHLNLYTNDVSAWQFASGYLFADSDYLKPYFDADDVNNQSKRLALCQFLRLAQSTAERFAFGGESLPIQEFLTHVKKLAHFNEDKNYAQIPAEAENLDAVRLLTVHSAKGLEFPAVFLPYLGAGKIPSNRKSQTCPNPDGMIEGEVDFHDAEEECLFFVAMSRARDHLHLSRSTKYGETTSNESKFLKMLAEFLPVATVAESTEIENQEQNIELPDEFAGQTFYAAELDRYNRCGRDYYYTHVLGLKAAGDKSIYLKFHSCVYDTLRSMQSMAQLGNIKLDEQTALARLAEFWQAAEVDLHAYAPIYKIRAENIIRRMCAKMMNGISPNEVMRPSYDVALSGGTVRVALDAVEIVEDEAGEKTAIVRKYKTGKSPKKSDPDDLDILMTVAVQNKFPDAKPSLQKIYLSDDAVRDIPISSKVIANRLKIYEKTIAKIKQGIYAAAPSDSCPYCPHFFICRSEDAAS